MTLDKNPKTLQPMKIELHHYSAKLKNTIKNFDKFTFNNHEVSWLPIQEIKEESTT
jgi:hypothetical protein